MTNKIVDGIDIIECQYFDLSENYECYCNHRACKDCPNCYYKQLKRKEQECERLKEENEKLAIKCMQNDEVSTFFNTPIEGWSDNPCDICESKQEYEKLQQEKDQIKKYLGISHKTILERLEELQDFKDKDTTKLLKYEQTLDEIEEICKNGVYDEFRMPLDECSVILNIINKTKE